jgi:hypothetical protein
MTSSINPNNIDGNYPVAGVPNNTQGFRNNFTNTKTNFQYAADEITELQSKSVFKSALSGSTLDNNMNDNLIYAVKLNDVSYAYLQNTTTSGTVTLDYAAGQSQLISTTGSVSLAFTNWPTSGSFGYMDLTININSTAHTLTLPANVSIGLFGLEGISPGTPGVSNTITFGQTGQFSFRFTSPDGGSTITIFDWSRPYNAFNNTLTLLAPSVAANAAGALNIVGSSSGTYQPVTNAGGMIHITGNDGVSSRITNDAFGTGAIPTYSTRAARGTAATPTAIQSGDVIARFGFTGWDGTDFGAPGGAGCAIEAVAIDNFTSSAQGTNLKLYTSPASANTKTLSMTVASNVVTVVGNVAVGGTGGIYITDGGTIGYNNGSGGTISQSGNKSQPVVLNKPSGEITMQATSLGADTTVQFTLTNSTIAAKDLLILNIVGGVATGAAYNLDATCSAGSAVISVRNITGGSLSEAIVLRYAVIKGSTT